MPEVTLTIEAATEGTDQERVRVSGLAYSGGKMKLPGWRHPVVVDLSGMEIPGPVPLLANHDNRTGSRVGVVEARVEGGSLVVEGEVLSTSGQAKGIVEQAKAGGDWQLSIGAEVLESELVRSRRTVNGQVQTGPFYHIRQSVLREVSVVAVGADVATRMRVAATFTLYGGKAVDFEKWLEEHGIDAEALTDEQRATLKEAFEKGEEPPALEPETKDAAPPKPAAKSPAPGAAPEKGAAPNTPTAKDAVVQADVPTGQDPSSAAVAKEEAEAAVRAERERVAAIQEICAGEFPKIERDAIRAGWSAEETGQRVLKAIRQSPPW